MLCRQNAGTAVHPATDTDACMALGGSMNTETTRSTANGAARPATATVACMARTGFTGTGRAGTSASGAARRPMVRAVPTPRRAAMRSDDMGFVKTRNPMHASPMGRSDTWGLEYAERSESLAMCRHLNVLLIFTVSIAFMWSQPVAGSGYEPDSAKYQQALRDVVEFSCKEFARYGITIDPSCLKYGDQEIVDSFLKGREYYRDGADVLVITPWLRRGTARCVYTR